MLSSRQQLVPVIERLPSAIVACIGDVMLDIWVHGEVSRISPEAPVPVLRVDRRERMLGGAGNAARNLHALGCGVRFFSAVGDDAEAAEVAALLAALTLNHAAIEQEPGRRTPVKTRFVAHGQQLLRADSETVAAIEARTATALLDAFSAALPDCSVVLLSDYAKGVLDGDGVQAFIGAARAAGKPVVVDPKGRDFTRYRGATLIKPNLRELYEATGLPVSTEAEVEAAARKLLKDTAVEFILVTRGPAGMTLVPRDAPPVRFPALAREVYDVSGAGDTVAAVLAAAIGSGAAIVDAVEAANIAAGIVVGKAGTAVVGCSDIIHEIRHDSAIGASNKVLQRGEAVRLAQGWKQAGLRVGFANGCFDLLHPGHLRLLETARAQCDRLLVGLNSDLSTKRLKGPARPIQAESARALVLASLNCVDGVVVFEENTPADLIAALEPDLLVKGSEYSPGEVVGAESLSRWGGKLLLVDMMPGWSTTQTVSRLGGLPD